MRGIKYMMVALLAIVPGYTLAESEAMSEAAYVGDNLARQPGNFRYVGNNLARQVCAAVVNDDVRRLKLVLLTYRRSLPYNYAFDARGRAVSRDFTCNGMDVQAFSEYIGAPRITGYFNGTGEAPDTRVAVAAK